MKYLKLIFDLILFGFILPMPIAGAIVGAILFPVGLKRSWPETTMTGRGSLIARNALMIILGLLVMGLHIKYVYLFTLTFYCDLILKLITHLPHFGIIS